jgi:fumarate hydratase class I
LAKLSAARLGIDAIRDNKAVYLIAVGGAAYLVSKAIDPAEVIAFPGTGYGSHL